MKKAIVRLLLGSFFALAAFTAVHAQGHFKGSKMAFPEKQKFQFKDVSANSSLAPEDNINSRALKDFSRSFNPSAAVHWYTIKDGFVAKFIEPEIMTNVYYSPKGRWLGTVKNYGEDRLPKDIRHLVRSTYYDYSIYIVTEVTTPDGTAYLVKIQDEHNWKTLRIVDGEMEVFQSFSKA